MFASRIPPGLLLAFFIWWTVLSGILFFASAVVLVGALGGKNTTATVLTVHGQQPGIVQYTTADGRLCTVQQKWPPQPDPVKVDDTFEVHYSRIGPCDNVARGGDSNGFLGAPVTAAGA